MIKLTELTDRQITAKLRAWLNKATAAEVQQGKQWYSDAQNFVTETAHQFNLEPYVVASVLSALSPQNKWYRNKLDTLNIIKSHMMDGNPYDVKVCTFNKNKERAISILRDGFQIKPNSPKTHSFAMNTGLLSDSHITVDRWHIRACCVAPYEGKQATQQTVSAAQYRRVEALSYQLAKKFNLKGYELQAIIWVTIKNHWENNNAIN